MRRFPILLGVLIICYVQLNGQHITKSNTDSVYIVADDNFSSVSSFKNLIFNHLDSIFKEDSDSFGCGKMLVFLRTNEFGIIDSCSIIESFRPDIDTLVIKTLKKINFGYAIVTTSSRVPISMNFTLPLKFSSCGKKNEEPELRSYVE